MASKAHGKVILYVSMETKGGLISLIHSMPDEVQKKFMQETGLRFVTYDQAINWALERCNNASAK